MQNVLSVKACVPEHETFQQINVQTHVFIPVRLCPMFNGLISDFTIYMVKATVVKPRFRSRGLDKFKENKGLTGIVESHSPRDQTIIGGLNQV
jgi:hypothetical protein